MKRNSVEIIDRILASRATLPHIDVPVNKCDEEGGCGVTGFISSIPVRGRHIYEPSVQMHNRGNGKGGGIAAVGLSAEDLGVTQEILDDHYLLQVAYLDPESRPEVEAACIAPVMDIHRAEMTPVIDDYREIGLEVKPPDVWRYFVRVQKEVLARFIDENGLADLDARKAEDEFMFQNTIRLNQKYYASLGEKQAFVMSHGRNVMILKIVGYAEQATQYYCLEDFRAHGWIAHQRYPTRGRLWHPGGAHPFSGMHEALVHNGDFANYHSVSEYLRQHNIFPQFLTDTEVAVLLLDLYNRTFEYPMEYIIEALAPTSEYDFDSLPPDKQHVYRYLQSQHMSASPDGPWFFIIARNDPYNNFFQLLGITDTAMLRPQVFALMEREEVQIGLVCSEKQAIDATLQNLAAEDSRFCPVADKYWNARGGSSTDGGAFSFTVKDAGKGDGSKVLVTANKFGDIVSTPEGQVGCAAPVDLPESSLAAKISRAVAEGLGGDGLDELKRTCTGALADWSFSDLNLMCRELVAAAEKSDHLKTDAIALLNHLNDRLFPTGRKKRGAVLNMVRNSLTKIFSASPGLDSSGQSRYRYIDFEIRASLRAPETGEEILVLNAKNPGSECQGI